MKKEMMIIVIGIVVLLYPWVNSAQTKKSPATRSRPKAVPSKRVSSEQRKRKTSNSKNTANPTTSSAGAPSAPAITPSVSTSNSSAVTPVPTPTPATKTSPPNQNPSSSSSATITPAATVAAPATSSSPSSTPEVSSTVVKKSYPNYIQVYAMVGVWKEQSLLLKGDGSKYKINTLNTVTRFGGIYTFSQGHFFTRYGFIIGQSENSSAVDNFAYFQRSVNLTGAELGLGANLLRTDKVNMGLSLGGIYRIIKHTVPSEEYRFGTGSRALPTLSLDLAWRFSDHWGWRQSIGSQGQTLDTFWSAGFSYIF